MLIQRFLLNNLINFASLVRRNKPIRSDVNFVMFSVWSGHLSFFYNEYCMSRVILLFVIVFIYFIISIIYFSMSFMLIFNPSENKILINFEYLNTIYILLDGKQQLLCPVA